VDIARRYGRRKARWERRSQTWVYCFWFGPVVVVMAIFAWSTEAWYSNTERRPHDYSTVVALLIIGVAMFVAGVLGRRLDRPPSTRGRPRLGRRQHSRVMHRSRRRSGEAA
jgi:hypothetical protein